MPRDEMLARMSGRELSAWSALMAVRAEERENARDVAESGDGVVVRYGGPGAADDEDEEEDDDGETE